jgi:magnesium transporter
MKCYVHLSRIIPQKRYMLSLYVKFIFQYYKSLIFSGIFFDKYSHLPLPIMAAKKHHRHKIRKKGLPPGTLIYTGHRSEAPSNVITLHFAEDFAETQLHYAPPATPLQAGNVLWIDVRNLTDSGLIEKIGHDFNVHPLALEDVLDTNQRAKLEEYDNGLFFILHAFKYQPETLELITEQISIFIGTNFVLSFQEDPDDTFAIIRKRALEGMGRLRKKGADYLAYALSDIIVDGYYHILDDLETHLIELEEQIHLEGASQHCKDKIFQLKRLHAMIRHKVVPLRDALSRLYRSGNTNIVYLRDVLDHVNQILDTHDSQREMLLGLESLYHAEATNRLNHVMRLLTVISTIFIPLSFIASVYGMNFDNMPELRTPHGYYVVLAIMGSLMVGMLAIFRWKRWI